MIMLSISAAKASHSNSLSAWWPSVHPRITPQWRDDYLNQALVSVNAEPGKVPRTTGEQWIYTGKWFAVNAAYNATFVIPTQTPREWIDAIRAWRHQYCDVVNDVAPPWPWSPESPCVREQRQIANMDAIFARDREWENGEHKESDGLVIMMSSVAS